MPSVEPVGRRFRVSSKRFSFFPESYNRTKGGYILLLFWGTLVEPESICITTGRCILPWHKSSFPVPAEVLNRPLMDRSNRCHQVDKLSFLDFTYLADSLFLIQNILVLLGFVLPVLIIPDWMVQQTLYQGCPSQCTCQRQMSLGCLFDVINKFWGSKPTFLSFNFSILCRPTNFTTKGFKVTLGLLPFFLSSHEKARSCQISNKMQFIPKTQTTK